ncbi:MAG: hypothetical protein H6983_04125 [Ectothiorhodospiraceae bacterium]|nr:hypothetical protein [Chromatiales bacterium]MCP5153330.1 hypothetical protein [Ectothiorhodospiraceae bacterium]
MSAAPAPGPDGAAGWRGVYLSYGVLSIVLLGDALLYVVLPVHAAAFGVSLAWVGVLLAANRVVRIFLYGLVADLAERIGLRALAIAAVLTACLSTLGYAVLTGGPALLAARLTWGLSYAALVLVGLGYAVADRSRTGTRVGIGYGIQQGGPIFALTVGTWLAGMLAPDRVFLLFAGLGLLALPLAMALPNVPAGAARQGRRGLPWPGPVDRLFFLSGLAIDGVFTMTITLLLAREVSLATAVASAGGILALRRVADAGASSLFGSVGDHVGPERMLVAVVAMLCAGLWAVAAGAAFWGSLAVVAAGGALRSVGPAVVARSTAQGVVRRLASLQAWRDVGAAVGPLLTGFALSWMSIETLYHLTAVGVGVAAAALLLAHRRQSARAPGR